MLIKRTRLILAMSLIALGVTSIPLANAKGGGVSARGGSSFSASRSVSYSRPATSSYTRTTASRPTIIRPKPKAVSRPVSRPMTATKQKKKVEYDYYPLAECTRIIKPINGYRCIDND